ncbi:MAG: rhomboid family intramembrane serine protease [Hymenobacteraceae bacterium]|nr:rhomboid family intramembrane serine protease [Hymenobacteraceae bacterium]
MTNFLLKLKLLFVPFILWGIGFTAVYTFLHWFLVIEHRAVDLKDGTVNFALPAAFTGAFVFIWLRKRINLLKLKNKSFDLPILYKMVATIALCAPAIIAQHYIVTATGSLSALENVSQISEQRAARYYTLKDYYLDKQNVQMYPSSETSGKYNEYLTFYLHAVVPVLNTAADTTATDRIQGWLGIKFSHQVSNRLSAYQKREAGRKFLQTTWEEFQARDLHRFQYLDRLSSSTDLDKYRKAVTLYAGTEPIVLLPVYKPYQARNGNKFFWIFGSLGIGSAVWLLMVSLAKFNLYRVKRLLAGKQEADKELQEFFSILTPRQDYFITPVIINLNLLLFILMALSGSGFSSFSGEALLLWGANLKPLVLQGEWWRIVTNIFLHSGIVHLILNMAALLFVAPPLESHLGKVKFAALYLTLGIAASLASIWLHERTISVGASGAIFGLYAFFVVLLIAKVFPKKTGKAPLVASVIFIAINLITGFTLSGIDNAAHMGGLVAGITIGLGYYLAVYHRLEDEQTPDEVDEQGLSELT